MDKPQRMAGVMLTTWLVSAATASAQNVTQDSSRSFTLSPGDHFTEQSGEALYNATCAGCHMLDGQGGQGAGHYPPLADNPSVAAATYVIVNVLHGRKGMPSFANEMNDDQVAAVVNYTRTHFGNRFGASVTASDVKRLR